MLYQVPPSQPFLRVYNQNFFQKISHFIPNLHPFIIFFFLQTVTNLHRYFFLIAFRFKRTSSKDHVKKYDSNWPDVSLQAIGLIIFHLWGHCNRCAQSGINTCFIFSFNLQYFRKSEISKFVNSVMNHDVLWFEIAVNNFFYVALTNSIDNLFEDGDGLIFRNFSLFFNFCE